MDLEAKLCADCVFWQKQLRLMDWDIQFIFSRTTKGKAAFCRKLSDYKSAEVVVADPATLPDSFLGNKDPEVSLVHELLHLQGEALDDFIGEYENGRWKNDQERCIELTAIALVNLRLAAIALVDLRS